jgi:hypothetical protein
MASEPAAVTTTTSRLDPEWRRWCRRPRRAHARPPPVHVRLIGSGPGSALEHDRRRTREPDWLRHSPGRRSVAQLLEQAHVVAAPSEHLLNDFLRTSLAHDANPHRSPEQVRRHGRALARRARSTAGAAVPGGCVAFTTRSRPKTSPAPSPDLLAAVVRSCRIPIGTAAWRRPFMVPDLGGVQRGPGCQVRAPTDARAFTGRPAVSPAGRSWGPRTRWRR